MLEKVGDVEAKANLQPRFYVWEIDFRYPKGHCPLAKKEDTDRDPAMRPPKTKTRLSPKPPHLLISLRHRPPRKRSAVVNEVMEAI